MLSDDRRRIRENYVCTDSLARLTPDDLAPVIPTVFMYEDGGFGRWDKALCIIARCEYWIFD